MESVQNRDDRKINLLRWLQEVCQLKPATVFSMPADASARRYFRFNCGHQSFVAMDAPPPAECYPFVTIATVLRERQVHTPEVFAANIDQGYLLLSDFGESTYLKTLTEQNADQLYYQAFQALAKMQTCTEIQGWTLPKFDKTWMWQEWLWHKEWFLGKLLHLSFSKEEKMLDECYHQLVELAVAQPQVFIHRDYHAANLMLLPSGEIGVLDFQDAFIGPITYDLVSLLRDCYIAWDQEKVRTWARQYWQYVQSINLLTDTDATIFLRWFDWMGVQRHLKALFTFARKKVRDQQGRYLAHVPRTLNYLLEITANYAELWPFNHFYREIVCPAFDKVK